MTACTGTSHEGGCLCGAVRYRVDGAVGSVTHCHCTSCRRSSGAAFVTWFTVPYDRFAWTGAKRAQFASSPGVLRQFCGTCGTDLTYENEKSAGSIDITVGSLDCAAGHPADRHIWTADRLDWLRFDDHLPTYKGWSTDR